MAERRREKKRMRNVGSFIIRDFFGGDSTTSNYCLLFAAPSFASDEPTHARSEDEQNDEEKHDGTTINPVTEGSQITTKGVSRQTNKTSKSAADTSTGECSLSHNNARTMALSSPQKHQLHRYSNMYALIDELLGRGNAQEKSGSVRTDVQARDDRSHSIFSTVTPLYLFDDETGTRRMYHLTSLTPPSIVLPTSREWAQYSRNMSWSDFHFAEHVDDRIDDDDDEGSKRKHRSLDSMRGLFFPPIIETPHHSSNKKS